MSTIHVRYNGESHDLDFESLFTNDRLASIGVASVADVNSNTVTSENVKTAVAQHFDVSITEFDDFQVEFSKNGNITVRPDAVFGTTRLSRDILVFTQPNGYYSIMIGDTFYSNHSSEEEISDNLHEILNLSELTLDDNKVSEYIKSLINNSVLIDIEDLQEKIDRHNLYVSKKIGSINCELHLLGDDSSFMEKITDKPVDNSINIRVDSLMKEREALSMSLLSIEIFCKEHL